MKRVITKLLLVFFLCVVTSSAIAFTISIDADQGTVGEKVLSSTCQQSNESSFTSDSHGTFYTDKESYAGGKSLELNIKAGQLGFGYFGGIVDFASCAYLGGRKLVKGEEIWVRLRIKFPSDFEFNSNGRNKFLRIRTHSADGSSEGYNDLYLDAPPGMELWKGYAPFQYIFEGAQNWYRMEGDFFTLGKWETIEYHIRLDDKKESEGGNPLVMVWLNGKMIGSTKERRTLKTPDSYLASLYLFTYWDNAGADKTQKLWIDDLKITSDTPSERDAQGFPFIGAGITRPSSPSNVLIKAQ